MRTIVFDNVRMTGHPEAKAGKCAIDVTPSNADMVFNRVIFDAEGTPQAINFITNYGSPIPAEACKYVFHDCTVIANKNWFADNTLPRNGYLPDGTIDTAVPVGFPDHTAAYRKDELWWIEGPHSRWDIAPGAPITKAAKCGIAIIKAANPATQNGIFHLSGGGWKGFPEDVEQVLLATTSGGFFNPVHNTIGGGLVDQVVPEIGIDFPIDITEGTSKREWDFYGPHPRTVPAASRKTLKETKATATRDLVPGRVYYVPVPALTVMASVGTIRATATTSLRTGMTLLSPLTNLPFTTGNAMVTSQAHPAITTGAQTWTISGYPVFPGYKQVYVMVGVTGATSATTSLVTSGQTVFYADGYTGGVIPTGLVPLPLAVGEAYPAVELGNIL